MKFVKPWKLKNFPKYQICCCNNQGCGVGVVESEGFSTWGVGVTENFNDSDSGQTFCSPIVTVCATNGRKRHTWQFKPLDASTRDDHGYSDRWQRTTCIPSLRDHSISAAFLRSHHATYTLWMQLFGLVSLKFPFARSGWQGRVV